jgi:hypothetical protein
MKYLWGKRYQPSVFSASDRYYTLASPIDIPFLDVPDSGGKDFNFTRECIIL